MSADKPMTIIEHLNDLRKALIISIIAWFLCTLAAYFGFRDEIFRLISLPIDRLGLDLVILTPFEGFMVKLKAAMFAGTLFALPVILWQVWTFILPALHTHERRYLLIIVPISLVLFLGGAAFSYFTVLGVALRFLIITAGEGFIPMLGASKYLSFVLAVLLPFGLVFQLPLISLFLTRIGLVTYKFLSGKRKYALLLSFIIAAVLTPPDVFTQIMMALPMILLYEISIWISWLAKRKVQDHADS